MNNKPICEKCGHEMKPISESQPVGMTCPNCGWGWATTYIEPILLDENDYHIILISDNSSLPIIKKVAAVVGCNYLQAKEMIENSPVEIYCGKAPDVKVIAADLVNSQLKIKINPAFPY